MCVMSCATFYQTLCYIILYNGQLCAKRSDSSAGFLCRTFTKRKTKALIIRCDFEREMFNFRA